jgi:hypothetical protein
MVGERGFEPPTPWSRSRSSNSLTHWSGSAYQSSDSDELRPIAPNLMASNWFSKPGQEVRHAPLAPSLPSWTSCHIHDMVCHMKTTLNIDETVMAQLKREAARQRRTMSELVETALRMLFQSTKKRGQLPTLPTFHSGGTLVDVAGRDALYQAMEGR